MVEQAAPPVSTTNPTTSATARPPATVPASATAPAPTLLLIAIDGFRPDYLQRGITPVLSTLAKDGVLAPQGMQPSFPSLTFPNHYTLVTGLTPGRHGIVNNTMSDSTIPGVLFSLSNRAAVADARWWEDATPLWVSAERQGIPSATMFWPGSEAAIHGVRPADWRVYDYNFPAEARVDAVLAWLDRPVASRPKFITLYFEAVDSAGHKNGPDGADTNVAIANVDAAIGKLVDGLKARGQMATTNFVIVADHGMAAISPERTILIDELVDTTRVERFATYGQMVGFTPLPGQEADVTRHLTAPRPHVQCWPKADVPARFDHSQHRRVPAVVCLADTGWTLITRENLARNPPRGGAHGYDPAAPEMAALFLAHGPAFKAGTLLPGFVNVDVYPLLAKLAGVRPQPNQGTLATFAKVLTQAP